MENCPEDFRSGYVALIGRPNVGKSTLLNKIIGQKISIVTNRPQTTRNTIIGIKNLPQAQIIFIDTPGIHRPKEKLGQYMLREATKALREVDLVVLMVEPKKPSEEDIRLIKRVKDATERNNISVILAINKIDRIRKSELLPIIDKYQRLMNFKEIIPISALKGDGLEDLLEHIVENLPQGPRFYPEDMVTDQIERFMVSEIIREKIIENTREEIPYAVAVEVIQWEEKKDKIVISANIYVEKESQKGIIIGNRGQRLKRIGTEARKEIESILNSYVYLQLWVKVKEQWRKKSTVLKELGYY